MTAVSKNTLPRIKEISPQDKAMLSRLVSDPKKSGYDKDFSIDPSLISQIFRSTAKEVSDIKNIFKLLPWLNLSREILISSIVSPGDLTQVRLNISNLMTSTSPTLITQLDKVLKDFFLDEIALESKIYDWVDKAMVMQGSYPILLIPESSLDKLINTLDSAESFESALRFDGEYLDGWFRPKGLLGLPLNTPKGRSFTSFESYSRHSTGEIIDSHTIKYYPKDSKTKTITLPIQVTDNPAIFRKPIINKLRQKYAMRNVYGKTSFESRSRSNSNPEDIYKNLFRTPNRNFQDRISVIPTTRIEMNKGLGHPLEFHLPSESVIPITAPGDVSNHSWYIIITDSNGYPVSYNTGVDYYNDVRQYITNNSDRDAGDIIQYAKETMFGNQDKITNIMIDNLTRMNSDIIEKDLIARIQSGMLGGELEISMPEVVKRMLLARTLEHKRTSMVLVPAEYLIYIAYDYNDFGIGKSILDEGKELAAQAAAIHVANVLGSIQNSIPGKDINIELDPDDRNPMETVHFMLSEAMGMAYREFPLTLGTTAGLTEQLQMSAFNVNVSGNPRFPEVRTTITPRESAKVEVDQELAEDLNESLNKLFGLTSEMVDNTNQPEFATTAVNNSLMLLKRVMISQAKTNPYLSDYIKVFTYNSGVLIERLNEVIDSNKKEIPKEYKNRDDFLEDYINGINCKLPEPQTENIERQADLLEKMNQAIDTALDEAYFKEELLAGFDDEVIDDAFPIMKESLKALILRKWMRDHGVFKELDVFTIDEDGNPVINLKDEMADYTKTLRTILGGYYEDLADYIERNKKKSAKLAEKVNKAKESYEDESEYDDDSYSEGDGDFGSDESTDDEVMDEGGESDDEVPSLDDDMDDDSTDDFDEGDEDVPELDDEGEKESEDNESDDDDIPTLDDDTEEEDIEEEDDIPEL